MTKHEIVIELSKYNSSFEYDYVYSYTYKELFDMLKLLKSNANYKLVKLGYTFAVVK